MLFLLQNDGVPFPSTERDTKQHGDKLNIFSSELIFGDYHKDEKSWYSIVWCAFEEKVFQALESVQLLSIDSVIKICTQVSLQN